MITMLPTLSALVILIFIKISLLQIISLICVPWRGVLNMLSMFELALKKIVSYLKIVLW